MECKNCGSEFDQNFGRGRPLSYCSVECRDAQAISRARQRTEFLSTKYPGLFSRDVSVRSVRDI